MRSFLAKTTVLCALALAAGCIGENRKAVRDPPPPPRSDTSKGGGPLLVYREIGNPATPTNTIRLVVEKGGSLVLQHGSLTTRDRIEDQEKANLEDVAGRVPWDKVPLEYAISDKRTPPKDGLTYEVTWGGLDPAHTVTTHDGVDSEDESFTRLRAKLREIAKRLDAR